MVFGLSKCQKKQVSMKEKIYIIKAWTLQPTQEVDRKKKLEQYFKIWESYISVLKKNKSKNDRIFSLAWNIVYWLLKGPCFEFFGHGKYGLFWAKKVMEIYLLVTEKFLFWTFRGWEIRFFLRQKVDGKIIFTDYLKVLVLNFSGMGNTVFFWGKKSMERWYLLFTEKFLFGATETFLAFLHKTFRWWKIRLFF